MIQASSLQLARTSAGLKNPATAAVAVPSARLGWSARQFVRVDRRCARRVSGPLTRRSGKNPTIALERLLAFDRNHDEKERRILAMKQLLEACQHRARQDGVPHLFRLGPVWDRLHPQPRLRDLRDFARHLGGIKRRTASLVCSPGRVLCLAQRNADREERQLLGAETPSGAQAARRSTDGGARPIRKLRPMNLEGSRHDSQR
jgi:hypothetical protein